MLRDSGFPLHGVGRMFGGLHEQAGASASHRENPCWLACTSLVASPLRELRTVTFCGLVGQSNCPAVASAAVAAEFADGLAGGDHMGR